MNNELIIYSYTSERLKEFKNHCKESDIILSTFDISKSNPDNRLSELSDEKNIYVDITTLYRSPNCDPLLIDQLISQIRQHNNWHIIINSNSLARFKSDFGQYIDESKPIQSLYSSKKTDNDFSCLNNNQLNMLYENLEKELYGHKKFKEELINEINNYSILYNLDELKIMSLLICGDSGTGKTELARIIHNTLFGDSKMIKINLGNYKTQGAINSLIGSPKGYYGSERGGELSNKIRNSDSKVILIDEFEKADTDIFNFFYELLEDGKFTDLNENEFNLNGYLIIFTTNLDENNYKDVIPSPLLSRFTMKVLFEQPSFEVKNKYIKEKSTKLVNKYNTKYDKDVNYKKVIKHIDKDKIKKVNNFRYLNKIIQDALIYEIKNNDNQKQI